MSILIKGMDMPEDENVYWFKLSFRAMNSDKEYGVSGSVKNRIIEIPTPHGRLIDADESMKHLADDDREAFTKHQVWLMFSEYGAPTIIEAEE